MDNVTKQTKKEEATIVKKSVKAIGITTALAVMIPLTAYAASTAAGSSNSAGQSSSAVTETAGKPAHFGKDGFRMVPPEVLTLLKLDEAALRTKLGEGKTLAQIAEAQGVSRAALKTAMTDAFNQKLEREKKAFTDGLDGRIDTKGSAFAEHEQGMKPFAMNDLSAVANVLVMTQAELKTALAADKSLADIAKDKGVDVQKLIDAEKAAITTAINQAVKDGKVTQAQADKRLAEAGTIAEKIVNGKGFRGGDRFGGGHGGGHHKDLNENGKEDSNS